MSFHWRTDYFGMSLFWRSFGLSSRYRWVHADFHVFLMYFHWRTDDFGMSAWPWPGLLFLTRQTAGYLRWFSAVFRSLSYFSSGIIRWHRILPGTSDRSVCWVFCLALTLTILLYLTRKIACFMYHDFQQFSGLSHTSFQELSGDVGSCLAPQIGRFDVENLDSKNPEIYHDFLPFSGKNPGSYHVFRTFPGANPEFCHVFLPFPNLPSFLTFSGPVGRRQGYNCNLGTRDFWGQAQLEGDRATTAIWEPEIFWWQAQLKGERATTAIWEPEIFGGRPSWKATRLQLQSWNSRFLVAGPVGRRQGYNSNLGTRDFLVAGPVKRRKGYNCNLGTRDFWGQAQLEGDRATTAIWELVIFWWQTQLKNDRATTTVIWELVVFTFVASC